MARSDTIINEALAISYVAQRLLLGRSHTITFFSRSLAQFFLDWTPFSTHMVLILFLFLQQRKWGGADLLYFLVVNELLGFGVIEGGVKNRTFSDRMSISGRVKRAMSGAKKKVDRGVISSIKVEKVDKKND